MQPRLVSQAKIVGISRNLISQIRIIRFLGGTYEKKRITASHAFFDALEGPVFVRPQLEDQETIVALFMTENGAIVITPGYTDPWNKEKDGQLHLDNGFIEERTDPWHINQHYMYLYEYALPSGRNTQEEREFIYQRLVNSDVCTT